MKKACALLLALIVLCACTLTACQDPNSPEALAKKAINTVALTVNGHKINAVELNYFYMEMVNSFVNEYSYYIYYMLDVSKPLSTQTFDEKTGQTWADRFLEMATTSLKGTYILYDAALEAGMTLTEAQERQVDSMIESLEYYAEYNKFDSVDAYLEELFGYGASLESYRAYYRVNLLADSYYAERYESLNFDAETLAAYEAKNYTTFNSYNYAYYIVYASKYLNSVQQDTEDKQALSVVAAEADAKALAAGKYADAAAFNTAIAGLKVNASLASVSCTEKKGQLYGEISSTFNEWVSDSSRVSGDTTVVAKTVTGENGESMIDGYYVVVYFGMNENRFALKNVRHLLITPEKDTDEAKAAAKAEAEALLAQWESGAKDEASFAELANKESDDQNGYVTDGGLYQNVYPGQMVESFETWCYDENRKPGDYGIVESEHGYHIMYFVGDSETLYRDHMVLMALRGETISAWYNEELENAKVKIKNLDFVDMDIVLAG